MTLQEKINKHLEKEVKREIMIKEATKKAQASYEKRRTEARNKIEQIKEAKKLNKEYSIVDYDLEK